MDRDFVVNALLLKKRKERKGKERKRKEGGFTVGLECTVGAVGLLLIFELCCFLLEILVGYVRAMAIRHGGRSGYWCLWSRGEVTSSRVGWWRELLTVGSKREGGSVVITIYWECGVWMVIVHGWRYRREWRSGFYSFLGKRDLLVVRSAFWFGLRCSGWSYMMGKFDLWSRH